MKITGIEPILAGGRYLFVKVHTDEGLVGLGECGAWAYQEATVSVLKQMEKMILGQDPLRTEFIWNALSRNLHFRGSVTQSALSGIDIALWDLKGKYFQVPCYELMGGKVREKIKIYVNARARDARGMAAEAKKLADQGFQSIRFSIGHPKDENGRCGENFTSLVTRVEGIMKAVRDAVGWNVDVAIECHRGMRPAEAIELGRVLRPYRPYFYEDPIPDNLEAMRQVIRGCDIPVATGEGIGLWSVCGSPPGGVRLPDDHHRRPLHPPGHVRKWRSHRGQEDRRGGGSARGLCHSPQSAGPGIHCGLPAAGRLHSQLRSAGISHGQRRLPPG